MRRKGVFEPGAVSVGVFWEDEPDKLHALKLVHDAGLFEGTIPYRRPVVPYKLRIKFQGGHETIKHDTYFFSHELSDFDLHLFGVPACIHVHSKVHRCFTRPA